MTIGNRGNAPDLLMGYRSEKIISIKIHDTLGD